MSTSAKAERLKSRGRQVRRLTLDPLYVLRNGRMQLSANRLVLLLMLVLTFCPSAQAKWVEIPTEDLVGEADIAVIGRPTQIRRYFDGYHEGRGTAKLAISKWLFGDVPHTASLPVEWQFDPLVVESGDIDDNSTHLWLLTVKDRHFVRPFHQFILPATTESAVLKATQNPLRAKQVLGEEITTFVLRLTYRNLTTQTLELPLLEESGPGLVLPESMQLKVTRYPTYFPPAATDDITSFASNITYTSSPKTIKLAPGQSYSMDIKPLQYYAVSDQDGFAVRWYLAGYRESNPALMHNPNLSEASNYYYDPEMALWQRLFLMAFYSPTQEVIIVMALTGVAGAVWFVIHKRKRRKRRAE